MTTTCPACGTEVTETLTFLDGPVLVGEDGSPHTCVQPVMNASLADAAAAMKEADVERAVAGNVKQLGLLGYHTRNSRRSPEGWPDWVICGPRGVIFRELKRQQEKPTRAQQAWLDGLAGAGLDADVWRPSDLLSGRIAREMAALAGMRVSA